jgi:hypothetical protein
MPSLFGSCRWVKFEEDVEEGANRWSKPHVSSLSLHSLMELRSAIKSCRPYVCKMLSKQKDKKCVHIRL